MLRRFRALFAAAGSGALWAALALLPLLAGCGFPRGGGSSSLSPPPQEVLQVAFLDVGQGDAALIHLPGGGRMLIDGGPPEAGERVLQALRETTPAGETPHLDWIVGSHPHADHIGGLVDVLRAVPVERVLDPGYAHGTSLQRTYLRLVREKGVRPIRARAGQTHDLGGGARLEILAPAEPLFEGTESDANNNSIVARLVFGETAFLFTGDIEEPARERLLRSGGASAAASRLRSDVLKVSHHGSHNGTDAVFLRAVAPRYAVISCAAGNEYGHPHRETLELLRAARVTIFRTDRQGTILFRSDGRSVTPVSSSKGGAAGAADSEPADAPLPPEREKPPATSPPESASPASGAEAAATRGPVIGNRESRVYHAPDCPSLPAPERRERFPNAAAAEAAGFRPHRACVR